MKTWVWALATACVLVVQLNAIQGQEADCSLPKDKGPCDQDLTRHYYDSSDNKCKQFTYGGCDGNSNNFLSADICYAECGKEVKPCPIKHCTYCVSGAPVDPLCGRCEEGYERKIQPHDCNRCDVKNCRRCVGDDPTWCGECLPGYGLITEYWTCRPCFDVNCAHCNVDNIVVCTKCKPGYVLNPMTGRCEEPKCGVLHCEKCKPGSQKLCDVCEKGWKICKNTLKCVPDCSLPPVTGLCKAHFPRWYWDSDAQTCKEFIYGGCGGNSNRFASQLDCFASCGPEVAQCPVKNCEFCVKGHISPLCGRCRKGFKNVIQPHDCNRCDVKNCRRCIGGDPTWCGECLPGFGLITKYWTCRPCFDEQCAICGVDNIVQCYKCKPGYWLNPMTGRCEPKRPPCNAPHCKDCVKGDPDKCEKCKPGFTLIRGVCKPCFDVHCAVCGVDNPVYCIECKNGYWLNSLTHRCESTRPKCKVSYCKACVKGDPGTCKRCQHGYNLIHGLCKPCFDEHCAVCEVNNLVHCTKCHDGYLLNPKTDRCEPTRPECKVHYCKECVKGDPNACEKCVNGYNLVHGSCKPCFDEHCAVCKVDNLVQCIKCENGYWLNPVTHRCEKKKCLVPHCQVCKHGSHDRCEECEKGWIHWNDDRDCVPDCSLPPKTGPCKALLPRWYWDSASKTCIQFMYGGCGGNSNRFKSPQECYGRCAPKVKTCPVKNCQYCVKGYHISPLCGECEKGYKNVIQPYDCNRCDVKDCARCIGDDPTWCGECLPGYGLITKYWTCLPCFDVNCALCGVDNIVQCYKCKEGYQLNSMTGLCEQPQCDVLHCDVCKPGSANQCKVCEKGWKICKHTWKCTPDCSLPPESGSCYGHLVRWYWHSASKMCKKFVYGGCGGNSNNFQTEQQCYAACGPEIKPCPVKNCQFCVSGYSVSPLCGECQKGYKHFIQPHDCNRCDVKNCKRCVGGDPNWCGECLPGFAVMTKYWNCRPCFDVNCAVCGIDNIVKCYKCKHGYYLNPMTDRCERVRSPCEVQHCKLCKLGDPDTCVKCKYGFKLVNGACQGEKICNPKYCHANASCHHGKCKCNKGFYGDGVIDCHERCVCRLAGDPMVDTYDHMTMLVVGNKKYTLSKCMKDPLDPCGFNIEIKVGALLRKDRIKYALTSPRYLDISILGARIRMAQNHRFMVDDIKLDVDDLPFYGKKFVIYSHRNQDDYKEKFIVFSSKSCGIKVGFYGNGVDSVALVSIPGRYSGCMIGFCGDCNGLPDDLKTRNGKDVSGLDNMFQKITDSYEVDDSYDNPFYAFGKPWSTGRRKKGLRNQKLKFKGKWSRW